CALKRFEQSIMLAPKLADYSGMRGNSEAPGCRYGLYQRCRLVPSLHRQIKPVTMMLEQHIGHDDLMGWGWRAGSVAILHPVIRRLRKSNQSGHCWTVPEHRVCWKFVLPSTSIIALTSSFLWRSVQTFCGT